ncbi:2-phosphosulfolactate phosphatase [Streptomyces sp. HUAS TT7]|uniref:2-phosphosulfolactate phosphatase n=1 Tax=Streptomyces sp. HUAS TT7 TaxID=3447507 RepID=UPI003F65B682
MREHIWWAEQPGKGVRFDWGMQGAVRLADPDGCLVVVDVLSFSTTVSVAVQLGTHIYPCAPGDEIAAAYARREGAKLAVARHDVTPRAPWSLSPAGLRIAPPAARLVLPCPDGSAIAALAATTGAIVVAACLRNVEAVGSWLISQGYGTSARPVTVIAAGEHWPGGSLRPATEDLLGAGALIAELVAQGAGPLSVEAATARAACEATADLGMAIAACATSQHLAALGYVEDVVIAAGVDSCSVVPVLDSEGTFTPAR